MNRSFVHRASASFAALWLISAAAGAQEPRPPEDRLSLRALYSPDPAERVRYIGGVTTQLAWLADGVLQETRLNREKRTVELVKLDPETWAASPLLDEAAVLGALLKAGAAESDAREALGGGALIWNEARSGFALAIADDLFHVGVADGVGIRLSGAAGAEDEATFSPDGTKIAYLRGNDLFVSTIADGKEIAVTRGGSSTLLNGRLDWVYQEELYGRGNWRGFWWSPDSSRLAYLQLDESKVPSFTVLDHRPLHQAAHTLNYPKVGDPNPTARLGVVPAGGGATLWMTDPNPDVETLIVNVGFAPDGRVMAQWQNRAQTWLDLLIFDAAGKSERLLRETTKAWVERAATMPRWLGDGSFLWESDRDGFHHVYRHAADGKLTNAVTAGAWDVTEVHGLDEKNGVLYFSSKERSPITTDVGRIGLDGKGYRRLTAEAGLTMNVRFNPDFTRFFAFWTEADTPIRQRLHDGEGKVLRVVDENPSPAWKKLKKGPRTFQQVATRDGFLMETMLLLPPDFDETKKYPVMCFVYGGPNAPQVRNAFTRNTLLHQLFAQEGYVVWMCDNRLASGKGWGSAWGAHKNLGEQELADQLDGLAWLKAKPWVDGSRIGIQGWSYGGYLTAYAMTRSDAFKCGVAGAPVTDWRLYDSIYTERYMGLLSENAAGYEKSSILPEAKNLRGKLLLVHGTMDDNVHPQNTWQLLDAFHAAGKEVELMALPGSDHSPRALDDQWGYYASMFDFVRRNL